MHLNTTHFFTSKHSLNFFSLLFYTLHLVQLHTLYKSLTWCFAFTHSLHLTLDFRSLTSQVSHTSHTLLHLTSPHIVSHLIFYDIHDILFILVSKLKTQSFSFSLGNDGRSSSILSTPFITSIDHKLIKTLLRLYSVGLAEALTLYCRTKD